MTTTSYIKTALQPVLEKIKRTSFVPTYQASDAEAFGLLLSKYFEWNGVSILEAASHALEDANFHTEAGIVLELATKATQEG